MPIRFPCQPSLASVPETFNLSGFRCQPPLLPLIEPLKPPSFPALKCKEGSLAPFSEVHSQAHASDSFIRRPHATLSTPPKLGALKM